MGKYEDFDLDMKVTSDNGNGVARDGMSKIVTETITIITTSILEGCTDKCTNYCTKFCSNGCPTPTKDHPVASCHLKNDNGVQRRC